MNFNARLNPSGLFADESKLSKSSEKNFDFLFVDALVAVLGVDD